MQDVISLVRATEENSGLLHELQVKAFMPLYEKYQDDDTSPAKEPEERTREKIKDAGADFFFVLWEENPIGGICVRHDKAEHAREHVRWISPLFIIPEYQGKGIAQAVISKVFALYPDALKWKLATIKQEPGNCHLYEKMGFERVGEETVVNERLTLVEYEKSCVVSRRFEEKDAGEVSELITENFLKVNSKDYGIEAMQSLAASYNEEKVKGIADYAHMYVFEWNGRIVGVGSISSFWGSETESILLTIFALPRLHGLGIGRKIIATLEQDELFKRASRIEIPASITATEFYRKQGYDYKNGRKELDEEGHYRLEKFNHL